MCDRVVMCVENLKCSRKCSRLIYDRPGMRAIGHNMSWYAMAFFVFKKSCVVMCAMCSFVELLSVRMFGQRSLMIRPIECRVMKCKIYSNQIIK